MPFSDTLNFWAKHGTGEPVIAFAGQEFQKDPNTMFLVAGDATVPYEEVIKGIVLLKDAGIEKAGLMTQGK